MNAINKQDLIGRPVPNIILSGLFQGDLKQVNLRRFLGRHPSVIIGVPKAFTPVCTRTHLPDIIAKREKLRAAGIKRLCVIAPDNPWVMEQWRVTLGAPADLAFLGDGNLELIGHLGLTTTCPELFLGTCSKRFVLQTLDGRIERASVEESIYEVSCTSADNQLAAMSGAQGVCAAAAAPAGARSPDPDAATAQPIRGEEEEWLV